MTPSSIADQTFRTRRRALLAIAALYTLALLVATHWPSTDMPSTFVTVSDKIVHLGAYFVWTLLMLFIPTRASWAQRVGGVALLGVLLGAVDELTQPLPGINRSGDFYDFIADVIGIAGAIVVWSVWVGLRRGRQATTSPVGAISADAS